MAWLRTGNDHGTLKGDPGFAALDPDHPASADLALTPGARAACIGFRPFIPTEAGPRPAGKRRTPGQPVTRTCPQA